MQGGDAVTGPEGSGSEGVDLHQLEQASLVLALVQHVVGPVDAQDDGLGEGTARSATGPAYWVYEEGMCGSPFLIINQQGLWRTTLAKLPDGWLGRRTERQTAR